MKVNCHRCFLAGGSSSEIHECCDWGNCRTHCTENHAGFGMHYDASWGDKQKSYVYTTYKAEPSPGAIEEEEETTSLIKEWPSGGSLDLEGELW